MIQIEILITLIQFFLMWGCIPELNNNDTCIQAMDMSNTSSTYLGILIGAIIGALISWWIYNRQKKTSIKQDEVLLNIQGLDENHELILKKIEQFEEGHDKLLQKIFEVERRIDDMMEKILTENRKDS